MVDGTVRMMTTRWIQFICLNDKKMLTFIFLSVLLLIFIEVVKKTLRL
jgi:hypothetical protein